MSGLLAGMWIVDQRGRGCVHSDLLVIDLLAVGLDAACICLSPCSFEVRGGLGHAPIPDRVRDRLKHAPIPAFPRLQGKELEVPALSPAAELGARGFGAFAGCDDIEVHTELMNYMPTYQARQRFVGDTPSPARGGGLGWGGVVLSVCLQGGARGFSSSLLHAPPSRPSPACRGRSSRFRRFPRLQGKELEVLRFPESDVPPSQPSPARGGRSSRFRLFPRLWGKGA